MERVMLLLGGNIGDVSRGIDRAVMMLEGRVGRVVLRSSKMESEAWGFDSETPPFINQAVVVECEKSPEELLDTTQQIERELGRDRAREAGEKATSGERYCSREIDIDIIFYGERLYHSDRLSIPHPLMQEREFVLRPIVEIAPEWQNIELGKSCLELLDGLM